MSLSRQPHTRLEVSGRAACMCVVGDACTRFEPGHALHLIQARLAAATPSEWVDSIVDHVDETAGNITLRAVEDGSSTTVWNAGGAASRVRAGDPVAVHARYRVLAAGRERYNVLDTELTPAS